MPTVIRATGLMIEAEAVIAAVPRPAFMLTAANRLGMPEISYLRSVSDSERSVQFFLEAGGNFIWVAADEAEATRVVEEIARAKVGMLVNHWTAEIKTTFYSDDKGWLTETMHVPVDALTYADAKAECQAALPANTQTRKHEIVSIVPGAV